MFWTSVSSSVPHRGNYLLGLHTDKISLFSHIYVEHLEVCLAHRKHYISAIVITGSPWVGWEEQGLKGEPACVPFQTATPTVWFSANFFLLCASAASPAIHVMWNW